MSNHYASALQSVLSAATVVSTTVGFNLLVDQLIQGWLRDMGFLIHIEKVGERGFIACIFVFLEPILRGISVINSFRIRKG